MTRLFVTFGIDGALKGYFAEFLAEMSPAEIEDAVRKYCLAHFPKDWSFTYDAAGFEGQEKRHGLARLQTYLYQHDNFYAVVCRKCGKKICPCEVTDAHAACKEDIERMDGDLRIAIGISGPLAICRAALEAWKFLDEEASTKERPVDQSSHDA